MAWPASSAETIGSGGVGAAFAIYPPAKGRANAAPAPAGMNRRRSAAARIVLSLMSVIARSP
jgi:hypothetical protein